MGVSVQHFNIYDLFITSLFMDCFIYSSGQFASGFIVALICVCQGKLSKICIFYLFVFDS